MNFGGLVSRNVTTAVDKSHATKTRWYYSCTFLLSCAIIKIIQNLESPCRRIDYCDGHRAITKHFRIYRSVVRIEQTNLAYLCPSISPAPNSERENTPQSNLSWVAFDDFNSQLNPPLSYRYLRTDIKHVQL